MTCAQVLQFLSHFYPPCKVELHTHPFLLCSNLVAGSRFTLPYNGSGSLIALYPVSCCYHFIAHCCRCVFSCITLVTSFYHHFFTCIQLLPSVTKAIKRCEDHALYTLLGCVL